MYANYLDMDKVGIYHDGINIVEMIPFKTFTLKKKNSDKIAEVNCWVEGRLRGMVISVFVVLLCFLFCLFVFLYKTLTKECISQVRELTYVH